MTLKMAGDVLGPAGFGEYAVARRVISVLTFPLLVGLGIVFLLSNAGMFRFVQWQFLWPLVLIGIGVLFLVQRVRS